MRRAALVSVVLTLLAGCSWGQFGHDASRTSYAPSETSLTAANVGGLALRWSTSGDQYAGAFLAHGKLYSVDVSDLQHARLAAFSADGSTGCGGSPRTCSPLWTAPLAGALYGSEASAGTVIGTQYNGPAVAVDGDSVVTVSRTATGVAVESFDANGNAGCSGSPVVCTPRWRSDQEGLNGVVAVTDGHVLVMSRTGSTGRLASYSESGAGCPLAPTPCAAEWSSVMRSFGRLTLSSERIFVVTQGGAYVYDRVGPRACGVAGCPMTGSLYGSSPISVSGHWAYAPRAAWDLDALPSCPVNEILGVPNCDPTWIPSLRTTTLFDGPIVTEHRLVAGETTNGNFMDAALRVFDLGAAPCSATANVCQPIAYLVPGDGGAQSATAIKHLVFVTTLATVDTHQEIEAFDLDLADGCTGSPKTCVPVWRAALPPGDAYSGQAAIAGGLVAVSGATAGIQVFALPG